MKKDKKVMNENQGSKGPYMVFYVLSVLLLIYMLFSLVTSYQNFVQYCDTYGVSPTEVWFTGFQSILAAFFSSGVSSPLGPLPYRVLFMPQRCMVSVT